MQEAGEIVSVGELEVYKVGQGPKVIVWCHDSQGFTGKILFAGCLKKYFVFISEIAKKSSLGSIKI